jgi:hypothetical protein
MTQVGSVGGAAFGQVATFDGETLLSYCAAQLGDLNGEIQVKMHQQQSMRAAKEALTRARQLLAKCEKEGAYSPEVRNQILQASRDAVAALPPGATRDAVMNFVNEYRHTACMNDARDKNIPNDGVEAWCKDGYIADGKTNFDGNNAVSPDEFKNLSRMLEDVSEDINKNAELEMIGLQQLISQRQQAIQLTTNLLAKVNQGAEAIVANLK